jgi:hypothetical protein
MNIETAIANLKEEQLDLIKRFEEHYKNGIETSDYYSNDLSMDEWRDQFGAFIEMNLWGE